MGLLRGIDSDPFLPRSGMTTNPMTLRTVLGALRTPADAAADRPPLRASHDVREQAHTDPREQAHTMFAKRTRRGKPPPTI